MSSDSPFVFWLVPYFPHFFPLRKALELSILPVNCVSLLLPLVHARRMTVLLIYEKIKDE